MQITLSQFDPELVTVIEEDYGTDVPLPTVTLVVEYWGIKSQPIIDIVEIDGICRRYIEQGRKVSGKREASQIARDLGATVYC